MHRGQWMEWKGRGARSARCQRRVLRVECGTRKERGADTDTVSPGYPPCFERCALPCPAGGLGRLHTLRGRAHEPTGICCNNQADLSVAVLLYIRQGRHSMPSQRNANTQKTSTRNRNPGRRRGAGKHCGQLGTVSTQELMQRQPVCQTHSTTICPPAARPCCSCGGRCLPGIRM